MLTSVDNRGRQNVVGYGVMLQELDGMPSRRCASMCSVFIQPCGVVPFCFSDADLVTLTWDPVYCCSVAGIRFVRVGVENSLKLVWGRVVDIMPACWMTRCSSCDVEPK